MYKIITRDEYGKVVNTTFTEEPDTILMPYCALVEAAKDWIGFHLSNLPKKDPKTGRKYTLNGIRKLMPFYIPIAVLKDAMNENV